MVSMAKVSWASPESMAACPVRRQLAFPRRTRGVGNPEVTVQYCLGWSNERWHGLAIHPQGTEQTDPLQPPSTDFGSLMGNRITPCKPTELIS